jgi:hypothetical protein
MGFSIGSINLTVAVVSSFDLFRAGVNLFEDIIGLSGTVGQIIVDIAAFVVNLVATVENNSASSTNNHKTKPVSFTPPMASSGSITLFYVPPCPTFPIREGLYQFGLASLHWSSIGESYILWTTRSGPKTTFNMNDPTCILGIQCYGEGVYEASRDDPVVSVTIFGDYIITENIACAQHTVYPPPIV